MKKIFNILSLVLFLQTTTFAQLSANRTITTKIADLLAQQPAENQHKFLVSMQEMESFTPEEVALLMGNLKPQGGNNAPIEYLTNSFALYVMQDGKDALRREFVIGLLCALDGVDDMDNRAFIFELLKLCAKDEAVPKVAQYLHDEMLGEKAVRVLNAIGTREAIMALNVGLREELTEKNAISVIAALGDLASRDAEARILELLHRFPSETFQSNAYIALSKIGGEKSFDVFYKNAKIADPSSSRTNITALSLDYAQSLFRGNNVKLARQLAEKLYKSATVGNDVGARVATLELLTDINPKKQKKRLFQLVSDSNPILRHTALNLLGRYATESDINKLISSLPQLEEDVLESVLYFFAETNTVSAIPEIERNFTLLKSPEAKIAAYRTWTQLSEGKNVNFLIKQLETANSNEEKEIKSLLLSGKDEGAIDLVNNALKNSDKKTQLSLLDVLSQRSNTRTVEHVLIMTKHDDPEIRLAAYRTLSMVVNEEDFAPIKAALNSAKDEEIAFAQQAAIVALRNSQEKEQTIQELSAIIAQSSSSDASRYFSVLAGEGSVEALNEVRKYQSEESSVRVEAIKALASWPNSLAVFDVSTLLRTLEDEVLINRLFEGFINQINVGDLSAEQKVLLLKEAFTLAKSTSQKKSAIESLKPIPTFQAMAFASRYLHDEHLKVAASDVVMNIALTNKTYNGKEVRDWLEIVKNNLEGRESSYQKEAIDNHLFGMPSGDGYVSLFNGKDLTGWKGLVENPISRAKMNAAELSEKQIKADKQMKESWTVLNGELVFNGHGDNIATIKQYGDFELLLDWKLDKNGAEPDAGVYLRSTPQVQIWDIARTDVGAQVGSGGLYNNGSNNTPLAVADNPLGEWNAFKIRMEGENVWVWLNGILVVDGVALENFWDRNQPIFPIEQIELQAHGSRVWYRDIYIKEIPRKTKYTLTEEEGKEGFEVLFDGTNLDKWTSSPDYDITDEGYIRSNPYGRSGINLYTKEEYADFIYRFEFKLTPGANNGIGIRAPLEGDAAYLGMEIQVLDNEADVYRELAPYQYHGSVYGIIPALRGYLKPVGEWNEEEIRIEGDKISVTLNGKIILDGDLKEATRNGTMDKLEHPGLARRAGHVGFLGHGTEVFFRNVRIKKL